MDVHGVEDFDRDDDDDGLPHDCRVFPAKFRVMANPEDADSPNAVNLSSPTTCLIGTVSSRLWFFGLMIK